MKSLVIAAIITLTLALGACGQGEAGKTATEAKVTVTMKWITDHVFMRPESALYDAERDIIYVSNINGAPLEKDGNGFISRVKTDGTVVDLKWAEGLNAPKGMALTGGKLYVADVDRLVEIESSSGAISGAWDLKGIFLNDVTVDSAGALYISDNMANLIHRFDKGESRVWRAQGLGGPNGLYAENSRLLVAALGEGVVKAIAWPDGPVSDWVKLEVGLDGIAPVGNGAYLVSVFDGAVYYISPAGAAQKILDTRPKNMQSADIGYIPQQKLLLVPTFGDNRLTAYEVTIE